jgi:hypothetical protein
MKSCKVLTRHTRKNETETLQTKRMKSNVVPQTKVVANVFPGKQQK